MGFCPRRWNQPRLVNHQTIKGLSKSFQSHRTCLQLLLSPLFEFFPDWGRVSLKSVGTLHLKWRWCLVVHIVWLHGGKQQTQQDSSLHVTIPTFATFSTIPNFNFISLKSAPALFELYSHLPEGAFQISAQISHSLKRKRHHISPDISDETNVVSIFCFLSLVFRLSFWIPSFFA